MQVRSAPNPRTGTIPRLSHEDSRKFAAAVRKLRGQQGTSIYRLYVCMDYPRSSIYRWLSGATRIPVPAAREIAETLQDELRHTEQPVAELNEVVGLYAGAESPELRIRRELRRQGLRVERTISALRAAGVSI